MKLAQLKCGQKAKITNITADGPMKRRLMDMGLVIGECVEIERVAPLGDPIEVLIKGYKLSIRKKEAEYIGVDAANDNAFDSNPVDNIKLLFPDQSAGKNLDPVAQQTPKKTITVAVAGNPNTGKSTLINSIAGTRLHVGNWPGVTVGKKEVQVTTKDHFIKLIDLPGTYSASPYSQDQIIARNFLIKERPDLIINVVDATNLERNLYFTIQLLELGIPVVMALNMHDEVTKKGYKIDIAKIEELLKIKVVTTVATKKKGIENLIEMVNEIANHPHDFQPRQLTYDEHLEEATDEIVNLLQKENSDLLNKYPPRWLALKLLERDHMVLEESKVDIDKYHDGVAAKRLKLAHGEDIESTTSDARYAKANGLAREVMKKAKTSRTEITKVLDSIMLNRVLGIPIFLFAMWMMFKLTFDVSTPFVDWIDGVTAGPLSKWATYGLVAINSPAWFISLITEGVIGGVGFVMVFVPVITSMMFFITFLEGSGYMARAAFVMDKAMHSVGLHGNSFIPMILGFGCNVPAVYATRTLENPRDRILTSLLIPLMSCGARLPVYILFVSVFFTAHAGTVLWGLYMLGIVLAVLMGIIFKKTVFKGQRPTFILELPPYRIPTLKNLSIHTWEKVKHFIFKAGTFILAASVVVWFMLHIPWGVKDTKDSLLGQAGQTIAPVFEPLGFGTWQASVSLITGILAKEIVVGTMGEIYSAQATNDEPENNNTFNEDVKEVGTSFLTATQTAFSNVVSTFGIVSITTEQDSLSRGIKPYIRKTFTPLAGLAFMAFVLLYMPCLVTGVAMKQEFGTWKWLWVATAYGMVLAWTVSFIIYQGGRSLG
ncbi:ferrous iron transport protein B, partial [bacterium K02(2017)]